MWEYLRREMAPTPERWAATVRITLACLICTIPIMAFHLKQPVMVMIGMFMVTREDISTTLFGTIVAAVAATIACGLLLLYYMCVLDLTFLRVLCVPAFIGLGLMMMRVVNPAIFGLGVAICVGFGVTIPDTVSNIETLNRIPFYYWWAWILGLGVNLGVQCLMNPNTSRLLLTRGLVSRLEAVEALLRGVGAGGSQPSRSSFAALAFSGASEQLRLLNAAAALEPLLKKRASEYSAQIILVDRLVTAAAALEGQDAALHNEAVKKRLLRVADVCAAWRHAITRHHAPEISVPPIDHSYGAADGIPELAEMERVVELLPLAARAETLPDELKVAAQKKSGFLAPDAFTNPEHLRFAIKGTLAATICYLIFTLFAYPAIYTCVITCILCSLSTVGASVQKGVLRFAGAVVGGTLGFISLMYIFPQLDSLGGFWLPFGAAMALAAYVNFGSVRISYIGVQICLAFSKCTLQTYGTYTELKVASDRLIGIAFGLLVFGVINSRLWPVSALETMRTKLADVFRQLGRLASLPDEGKSPAPQVADAYNLRLRIYQDFSSVNEMQESSKFESGGEVLKKLEPLGREAKGLMLHLLAIIQHRPDLRPGSVPESIRGASAKFRMAMGHALMRLANRVAGKPEPCISNLESELTELERIVAAHIGSVKDAMVAAEIRARLKLYRQAGPLVAKLIRLEEQGRQAP